MNLGDGEVRRDQHRDRSDGPPVGPASVPGAYSFSKPWLVNFRVRLFSVTVRTTWSEAPEGISASTSSVTVTFAPTRPVRWAMTSSATRPASRPTRAASSVTVPWNRLGGGGRGFRRSTGRSPVPVPASSIRRRRSPACPIRLPTAHLRRSRRRAARGRRPPSRAGRASRRRPGRRAGRRAGRGSGPWPRRSCRRRRSSPPPRSAAPTPSRMAPTSTAESLRRGR